MNRTRHVALLRGINVGGKNIIKMADLAAAFEKLGFADVRTYIQSGNVVFSATRSDRAALTATIEKALSKAFRYTSRVVLVSSAELDRVVDEAPAGFGRQPDRYRYDVIFVRPPATTRAAFAQITAKPGVDEAHAGTHALYFRRLIARAAQSHLTRLTKLPIYADVSVRNWNTTTALREMACAP